jgi:hypothetical protein
MKYLVFSFFYCFVAYSQTNDSINAKKIKNLYSFNNSLDSIALIKPNFNYKFRSNDVTEFSIYDRNSKLNDIYYFSQDSLYYSKSVNVNINQFVKRDSFNPNGVNDLRAGIIIGSINTVFKSIFK